MRFALLGAHPDGLDFVSALFASGRHELTIYSGPNPGAEALERLGLAPERVGDLEEVLADPRIDAVIVAGGPSSRGTHLRRALQSERHVVCVHPADPSPDLAYEAAMIQTDTRCVLLPLLVEAQHPGVQRLAELGREIGTPPDAQNAIATAPISLPPASTRLLEFERWSTTEVLLDGDSVGQRPGLPGWDVLRRIGGEIAELYVQTRPEELLPGEPLLLSGRFISGGLWQASYLPNQAQARWRLSLVRSTGRATLDFPDGWLGPAVLTFAGAAGQTHTERWESFNPWSALVEVFEDAVASKRLHDSLTRPQPRLGWLDELRALELDDGARRSAERRRSSTLDHQEADEEASFKGTMTLVGCALIWVSLLLLILSIWLPWLGWLIVPVFAVFLGLQVLRWILPARKKEVD